MADDVAITAGSGTNIATDDCTTGHVQLVKLAYSADGVRTHATVDANGVLVDLGTNNDVTVTGSVTANAGTNLNTSLLALETTQGDVRTAVQLIDDGVATVASAITTKGMAAVGTDGTNARILKTDTAGELQVDILSIAAGTNYVGKVRLTDGTNDLSVDTAHNDGESLTENHLDIAAVNYVYNGTTKDMVRGAANALNSTGTGLMTAQIIGQFDDSTPTSITENQFGNLRMSANRNLYGTIRDAAGNERGANVTASNALVVDGSAVTQPVSMATQTPTLATRTSGGFTTYHLVSANTTNATNIKASAGQLYGWYIYNNNAAMRKVAFHNTAGTPTAGASIFFTINVPGGAAANVFSDIGIAFSSGIAITTVTDVTDAGTTAVGTSDLTINLFYA